MPFASPFELLVTRPAILTLSPLWALVPATLAFALYAWFRTPRLIGAAALWVAYMPFEFAMRAELFCHGDCLPRVDLLPVFGILCAASLVAIAEAAVIAVHDVWARLPERTSKRP
jgi:hypothetical protein